MALSPSQLAALKADILADQVLSALPNDNAGNAQIAAAYNAAASPAFYVYRSSVPMSEIMLNGFDWTRVDNLSVGKARIWDWMTSASQSRSIDPSKANIRAGINATWVGTAADLAVRAAVYAHCYKAATRLQKLFATGAGTAPNASGDGPAVAGYEGTVTADEVEQARYLP